MQAWPKLYPQIQGYFFDEQFSGQDKVAQYEKFFHAAHIYVKSPILYSNPGTECVEDYVRLSTSLTEVIFENNKNVDSYLRPAWATKYKPHNFAAIAWGLATVEHMKTWVARAKILGVGTVFVTDNMAAANPYIGLPTYWADLLKTAK